MRRFADVANIVEQGALLHIGDVCMGVPETPRLGSPADLVDDLRAVLAAARNAAESGVILDRRNPEVGDPGRWAAVMMDLHGYPYGGDARENDVPEGYEAWTGDNLRTAIRPMMEPEIQCVVLAHEWGHKAQIAIRGDGAFDLPRVQSEVEAELIGYGVMAMLEARYVASRRTVPYIASELRSYGVSDVAPDLGFVVSAIYEIANVLAPHAKRGYVLGLGSAHLALEPASVVVPAPVKGALVYADGTCLELGPASVVELGPGLELRQPEGAFARAPARL